ncbi:hypothetical protein BDZ94DRAFT_1262841 [Collybia nuda]|uniref:Uncharacterized protein n=1 Tax=Collybia nuda TaxID=64659 RepID=A0A9P6CDJ6_9AGAR|nr:hypothetical protein BDZ94DRAFT_1262841 [Collybia nuda]
MRHDFLGGLYEYFRIINISLISPIVIFAIVFFPSPYFVAAGNYRNDRGSAPKVPQSP